MALPCVLLPLLFPGKADANLPLRDRFWVKATVWISIFSHIGNYFWTHYFFELLGAEYTFKAHRLNGVSGRRRKSAGREGGRGKERERIFVVSLLRFSHLALSLSKNSLCLSILLLRRSRSRSTS